MGAGWKATIDGLGTTATVITVRRDVEAGSVLSADDVDTARWPIALIPDRAVQSNPVGLTVRADLVSGEVLVHSRLFPTPDGLDAGHRLVPLPLPLAPPPLSPGTSVELFGIRSLGDGLTTASTELTGGVVVHIDDQSIGIAIGEAAVPIVLEHVAFGVVDVIVVP